MAVQRAVAPGTAPVPARAAVRWWQDPKLTFGPPGDPEFLAKIPHQVLLPPMNHVPWA